MKLRNKLIPLTGIAAVAAVAAPLALTSCGQSIKMVDISKGYAPTIKPHIPVALGTHKTNQEYFADIKSNGDIFTQDYIYGKYLTWQTWKQLYELGGRKLKINSLKTGISTPTFGSVSIAYPGEPAITYPTISVTFKTEADINIEYTGYDDDSNPQYIIEKHAVTCSTTYKDMPFYAHADSEVNEKIDGYWYASIPYWKDERWVYNYNISDWSIDFDFAQQSTIKTVTLGKGSVEQSYDFTRADTIDTPSKMQSMFGGGGMMPGMSSVFLQTAITLGFPSYYLTGVVQVPELNSAFSMETITSTPIDTTLKAITLGDSGLYTSLETSALQMTASMWKTLHDLNGKIHLFADVDSKDRGTGDIVIPGKDESGNSVELTIKADGNENVLDYSKPICGKSGSDFEGFYGFTLPEATVTSGTISSSTEGTQTYKFELPTYIVAEITLDGLADPIVQKVYLNQDVTEVEIYFYD